MNETVKVDEELQHQAAKNSAGNRVPKCGITKILFLEYFNFGLNLRKSCLKLPLDTNFSSI